MFTHTYTCGQQAFEQGNETIEVTLRRALFYGKLHVRQNDSFGVRQP